MSSRSSVKPNTQRPQGQPKSLPRPIREIIRCKYLYLIFLIPFIYYIVFQYWPMYGILIAFKNFSMRKGIMGSPWVGFDNFTRLFTSYWFPVILKNTLTLSILSLILGFPIPIILALLLNEVKNDRFRKTFQTISYAPHFISVVVLCGMVTLFVSPSSGIINKFITMAGGEPVAFLQEPGLFKWVYVLSGVWQEMGWGSIIYFATLSGVDKSLIEAAEMDGASRLQKIWYINMPVLVPTIIVLLILNCGSLLGVGYEKVYLLQNATNVSASEVISTYVYKVGLEQSDFAFGTAAGLFNSVVNSIILIIANTISNRATQTSLF